MVRTRKWVLLLLAVLVLVGMVSATTVVINATHDGTTIRTTNGDFLSFRDGVGESSSDDPASVVGWVLTGTTTPDSYSQYQRDILTYNGSIIPDDAIIDSVTATFLGAAVGNAASNNLDTCIVYASPINPLDFVNADYNGTNFTKMAPCLTYASFTTGLNNYTLNSDGILAINKTGLFSFMIMDNATADNTTPTWKSSSGGVTKVNYRSITYGTTLPSITINYHNTPPVTAFSCTPTIGVVTQSIL